jgi:N utilization substance protein B
MNANPPKKHNPSLKRKNQSRLAAVQTLYRVNVEGVAIATETLITDILATWEENKSDPEIEKQEDPDHGFLKKLIRGIIPELDHLNEQIKPHLADDWKMERISPILLSILQCAVYELVQHTQLAPGIIIDEYVSLTHEFFGEQEVGFVHAILHTLAKEIRK